MKKILLSLEHFKASGSTQNFYHLYLAFKKNGYSVDVTSPRQGGHFQPHFGKFIFNSNEIYDAIIANHYTAIQHIENVGFSGKMKIFSPQISYIFDGSEFGDKIAMSKKWLDWADHIVTISQESFVALKEMGYHSKVVNQPVHTDLYQKEIPVKNKVILSCVRGDAAKQKIRNAAKICGYTVNELEIFNYNHLHDGTTADIKSQIKNAEIVIGIGRIVYESIAIGRPVIVYDERKYQESYADGLLDSYLSFLSFNERNCSGRTNKYKYNIENLIVEIKKASKLSLNFYDRCLNYFDSENALNIYKCIINSNDG